MNKKTFVLVDCNNFYASCERLFNPSLERKPIIVLSNNDGCVVSRSQEAKQLGIQMGAPYFQIRRFCDQRNVHVFSSNYSLYGDLSARVMQVLTEMAEEIQIYSIDEAFLLFSSLNEKELYQHCIQIKERVLQWVGIPISVGIGPTKTLSKVANDLAKKNRAVGIYDLCSESLQKEVLSKFPIGDVWGIGSRLKMRMQRLGIFTAQQFREQEPSFIRKQFGVVGERMLWELRGLSCLELEQPKPKKSITCSRSFGKQVTTEEELAQALAMHVSSACTKLRKQQSCAGAVSIHLEAVLDAAAGTRQYFGGTITFNVPTSDTPEVITAAKKCLTQLYRPEKGYKKCGVILLDIIPEASVTRDLFDAPANPKRALIANTVDDLNERYGKNTIFYGAMKLNAQWMMRSNNRSCQFTTSWDHLKMVS